MWTLSSIGQRDAGGVLVILLLNFLTGRQDIFLNRVHSQSTGLPFPKIGEERKICTLFYLCLSLPWLLVRCIL